MRRPPWWPPEDAEPCERVGQWLVRSPAETTLPAPSQPVRLRIVGVRSMRFAAAPGEFEEEAGS